MNTFMAVVIGACIAYVVAYLCGCGWRWCKAENDRINRDTHDEQ